MLVALSGTEAMSEVSSELAGPGGIARTDKLVDLITIAVGPMLFSFGLDSGDISLHQSAAKASRVRFSDDGKEPSRRRLYAAQELVGTMRAAARAVAFAFSHSGFHQVSFYERCVKLFHPEVCRETSIVTVEGQGLSSGYVV